MRFSTLILNSCRRQRSQPNPNNSSFNVNLCRFSRPLVYVPSAPPVYHKQLPSFGHPPVVVLHPSTQSALRITIWHHYIIRSVPSHHGLSHQRWLRSPDLPHAGRPAARLPSSVWFRRSTWPTARPIRGKTHQKWVIEWEGREWQLEEAGHLPKAGHEYFEDVAISASNGMAFVEI